jgi:hypothetical protein
MSKEREFIGSEDRNSGDHQDCEKLHSSQRHGIA